MHEAGMDNDDPGYDREERECPDCGGTGDDPSCLDRHPCDRCDGEGIVEELT